MTSLNQVEKRNPFINKTIMFLFYFIVFVVPLIICFASSIVSEILYKGYPFLKEWGLSKSFIQNILEVSSIMMFCMSIITFEYFWSKKKYELILKKIDLHCQRLIQGKSQSPLRFRKTDLFFTFGHVFNDFVDHYLIRKREVKTQTRHMIHLIENLPDHPKKEDIQNLLKNHEKKILIPDGNH